MNARIKRPILLIAAALIWGGCSALPPDTLFQVSTLETLMAGGFDGAMQMAKLRRYGDFGIGTLDRLDGEMVALDGRFYQIKADGKAYRPSDALRTPYAAVTFFSADQRFDARDLADLQALEALLDHRLPNDGRFLAVRIQGRFRHVKTRSVPAQSRPYPPLDQVLAHQPIFTFKEVEGVIVGFRSPGFAKGIGVPGYHFHFIDKERTRGGHLLECAPASVDVAIDHLRSLHLVLPEVTAGAAGNFSGHTRFHGYYGLGNRLKRGEAS